MSSRKNSTVMAFIYAMPPSNNNFWPFSNSLSINIKGRTLLRNTIDRLNAAKIDPNNIYIVTTEELKPDLIKAEWRCLASSRVSGNNYVIMDGATTYTDMVAEAAKIASEKYGEDAVVVCSPSDQITTEGSLQYYAAAIRATIECARNHGPAIIGVDVEPEWYIGETYIRFSKGNHNRYIPAHRIDEWPTEERIENMRKQSSYVVSTETLAGRAGRILAVAQRAAKQAAGNSYSAAWLLSRAGLFSPYVIVANRKMSRYWLRIETFEHVRKWAKWSARPNKDGVLVLQDKGCMGIMSAWCRDLFVHDIIKPSRLDLRMLSSAAIVAATIGDCACLMFVGEGYYEQVASAAKFFASATLSGTYEIDSNVKVSFPPENKQKLFVAALGVYRIEVEYKYAGDCHWIYVKG